MTTCPKQKRWKYSRYLFDVLKSPAERVNASDGFERHAFVFQRAWITHDMWADPSRSWAKPPALHHRIYSLKESKHKSTAAEHWTRSCLQATLLQMDRRYATKIICCLLLDPQSVTSDLTIRKIYLVEKTHEIPLIYSPKQLNICCTKNFYTMNFQSYEQSVLNLTVGCTMKTNFQKTSICRS